MTPRIPALDCRTGLNDCDRLSDDHGERVVVVEHEHVRRCGGYGDDGGGGGSY